MATSTEATVTVTVNGTNDRPIVSNINLTTTEDGPIITEVFAGADVDNSTLTYTDSPLGVGQGTLTNNGNGTFTFNPGADFQSLAVGESRQVTSPIRRPIQAASQTPRVRPER